MSETSPVTVIEGQTAEPCPASMTLYDACVEASKMYHSSGEEVGVYQHPIQGYFAIRMDQANGRQPISVANDQYEYSEDIFDLAVNNISGPRW